MTSDNLPLNGTPLRNSTAFAKALQQTHPTTKQRKPNCNPQASDTARRAVSSTAAGADLVLSCEWAAAVLLGSDMDEVRGVPAWDTPPFCDENCDNICDQKRKCKSQTQAPTATQSLDSFSIFHKGLISRGTVTLVAVSIRLISTTAVTH